MLNYNSIKHFRRLSLTKFRNARFDSKLGQVSKQKLENTRSMDHGKSKEFQKIVKASTFVSNILQYQHKAEIILYRFIYTGRVRLIRIVMSATFSFELSEISI